MKKEPRFLTAVFAALAILLAACTAEDVSVPVEGEAVSPALRFSVSDMEMKAVSRAESPMSPDMEKYVKTMAVFEFDNEGLHTKGSSTYHYIDFLKGTVDGRSGVGGVVGTEFGVVESSLRGIKFERRSNGMICCVANVTEEEVDSLYDKYREPGQSYGSLTFEKFKEWGLPFDYETKEDVSYDQSVSGHLKNVYMFGYYQGPIAMTDEPEDISIDLGRLASRLDITVVNETGRDIDKRFGYHFDNVCHKAYFFPLKMSLPPTSGAGLSRTVICTGVGNGIADAPYLPETFPNGNSHTHYFYVAAHSAADESEATKLHLFWNCSILGNDFVEEGGKDYHVPLCNVLPSIAPTIVNGYSLSRNTRYHFTIRLKSKSAAPAAAPASRSDVSYVRPDEIEVYLP